MTYSTPRQLGFRMPAEWEPHEGTWLSWPKDPITFPDRVPQVESVYIEMMFWLSQGEKVFLLVDTPAVEKQVRTRLMSRGAILQNVEIIVQETVDVWIRDYGPNFIVKEEGSLKTLAFNHWLFNAWGEKYEELIADTEIPPTLNKKWKYPMFTPKMILEGGSIDVNGMGVCLTTRQCLLNRNRNPHLGEDEIETRLREFLGVEKIVWLGDGLEGDDTDGHVDDITRFVSPGTVVTVVEEDRKDPNAQVLQENFRILNNTTDVDGRKLQVIPLPTPGWIGGRERRLPASYANFYIGNKVILAPTFDHKNDAVALDILRQCFPKRDVVAIDCKDLIWGMGAIHCVTQQQPLVD